MVPRTRSAEISTRLARWVLAAQVILLAPSLRAQLPERFSDQDYWKLVGEISHLRYVYDSFLRIGPWINASGQRYPRG